MEIATREVEILTKIKYFDKCTKTTKIDKQYVDNTKTPVFKYKVVEFRYPDGRIDEDRSYHQSKMLIDESYKRETEYNSFEVEMLKTIYYNDGCIETIKLWKIYKYSMNKSYYKYKKVEFRNRNGTINKDRSYDSSPFDESERKDILRILTNNPKGYDAYPSEYSKLFKKYDQYNGFQLSPNDSNIMCSKLLKYYPNHIIYKWKLQPEK